MGSGATSAGTAAYAQRLGGTAAAGHFRAALGLTASSIGLGTYLGREDDATDRSYREAIETAVAGGINVLDTAVSYRRQRSERAIGAALAALTARGFTREEIVVSTKAGYVPAADAASYFQREIVSRDLARPADLVAGCHSLAPGYLRHQLETSLRNLGLRTVDVLHLHNPEQQLDEVPPDALLGRLRSAFEMLEREVADGRVGAYGTATWNGYRVRPGHSEWLSLETLVQTAQEVAGNAHHFKVVQLPFSLAMPEALVAPTQTLGRTPVSLLAAARELGITVMGSASLMQGRLARGLPLPVGAAVAGLETDGQRALQVARSAPGLTTALVGMSRVAHVRENLALVGRPPLPPEAVTALLQG
ncbi:MAG TPA: aldo/keto reductase [Vicinamibacteria bacterium]|nr:aldo/keto reductase [Vicinamibacteria bacterium]